MSDRKLFPFQAIVEKVSTRKGDKSLIVTLGTQDLKPQFKAAIFEMQDEFVTGILSPYQPTNEEVVDNLPQPEQKSIEPPKYKSKSQKLRHTLKLYYEARFGTSDGFEQYYQQYMEGLIEKLENRLKQYTHE
jgi:hypothetical protein